MEEPLLQLMTRKGKASRKGAAIGVKIKVERKEETEKMKRVPLEWMTGSQVNFLRSPQDPSMDMIPKTLSWAASLTNPA